MITRYGVKGLLLLEEADRLAELAGSVNGIILEIGAYQGLSTCVMGMATKAKIYSIDAWSGFKQRSFQSKGIDEKVMFGADNFKIWKENIKRLGINATPIQAYSSDISEGWNKNINLLFIDGDHSYSGVKADYEGFAHHVLTGGYIVFHDYNPKFPGVIKLVSELQENPMWDDWQKIQTIISARRVS